MEGKKKSFGDFLQARFSVGGVLQKVERRAPHFYLSNFSAEQITSIEKGFVSVQFHILINPIPFCVVIESGYLAFDFADKSGATTRANDTNNNQVNLVNDDDLRA